MQSDVERADGETSRHAVRLEGGRGPGAVPNENGTAADNGWGKNGLVGGEHGAVKSIPAAKGP